MHKISVLMKFEPYIILKLFLNLSNSDPYYSYRLCFYKKGV